jgi:hypothetical protein
LLAAPFVSDADIAAGTYPDVGRGVAADIDPNHAGFEFWDSYSSDVYDAQGNSLYAKPSNMFTNFVVYWDADSQSELLDGTTISNWNNPGRSNFDLDPATSGTQSAPNASSNNGTKSTPSLTADIFGDWREEVIWRRSDNTALEIFTTTTSAVSRTYTLMHDSQYREAVAWQNVGYNQPPHASFLLSSGAPVPQMSTVALGPALLADFNGDRRVDALDFALWKANVGKTSLVPGLVGDANGDLTVDGLDYLAWQQNVGATSAALSAQTAQVATVVAGSAPLDVAFAQLASDGVPSTLDVATGPLSKSALVTPRLAPMLGTAPLLASTAADAAQTAPSSRRRHARSDDNRANALQDANHESCTKPTTSLRSSLVPRLGAAS